MSVSITTFPARGHDIKLVVEQTGLQVVVRAGAFTFKNQPMALVEDTEFTAEPDDDHDVSVVGYLAIPVGGGDVVVVVDEVVMDGADDAARFDGYNAIHPLFRFSVPKGATDLDVKVEHLAQIAGGEVDR